MHNFRNQNIVRSTNFPRETYREAPCGFAIWALYWKSPRRIEVAPRPAHRDVSFYGPIRASTNRCLDRLAICAHFRETQHT